MGSNRNTLMIGAAVIIVVLVGVFAFGGGHNMGKPSAPGGPGNVMKSDPTR